MKKKTKQAIGGQAVIEGVMMKSKKKLAIAVRKPNKKITVKKQKLDSSFHRNIFFRIRFIRGIFVLIDTMVMGINALSYSANQSIDKKEEKLSKGAIALTIGVAALLAVGLFIVLPLFLTRLVTESDGVLFNLIDGVIRIGVFFAYIGGISFMKDVKRMFQYHGAEHKSVFCYESGKKLTVKNAKKFSCLHPRCGTTFIIIVLALSILLFSLVTSPSWVVKLLIRLAFIPVIAGLSYEFIRWSSKYYNNPVVKILVAPGLAMQLLTTREPDNKQIEVAIKALKAVC
ncbi:DUF1385 domain-containing protein [Candidatus Woesearchaeota archaeon]|nr:DUF1385 domain-containing protein [Candidatus Woesearchaeota archaeon]